MRILLVENRFVLTAFYEIFSKFPECDEIRVLIFNKAFLNKQFEFKYYTIIPNKKSDCDSANAQNSFPIETGVPGTIRETDRQVRFFSGGTSHYYGTNELILKSIEDFLPDIIVGERTTFYELLCSNIAKQKSIPYVSPQASRYPTGKTLFVRNQSNLPYELNKDNKFQDKDAFVRGLLNNSTQPSYMQKRGVTVQLRLKLKSLLFAVKSRYFGDYFCTPPLFHKIKLDLTVLSKLRKWRRVQEEPQGRYATFALQLQPEANLDVDAGIFSDQKNTIIELNSICSKHGFKLYVKGNPKAKYELLDIDPIHLKDLGIGFLPLDSRIFTNAINPELVISSTGTALIESVFHDITPISLGGGALFMGLGIPVIYDFVKLDSFIGQRHLYDPPSKDRLLDQLSVYCIDYDYPDPNLYIDYYKDNAVPLANKWREILELIVNNDI